MRFLTETDFPPSEKTKLRRCHNSPPSPDFLLPLSQSTGSPGFFNLYYHNFFILALKKDVGVKRVCKNSLTYHIVP
ncbi:hypothetical protein, partial [Eisenbergiella massiliensis]|uniref:hypothetical protein n=1 Tax=Eisenbergiella massiliensis TaxID=1720294 RepID=UPI0023F02648